ncbi:MAG TPA: hypothetical protein VKA31_03295 [Mariprofundaceae bacterium]|nr:hypothetical protein [Mariprofundaceae bacterium]
MAWSPVVKQRAGISLNFHFTGINLARMQLHKRHASGLSRLIAGLFAMQVIVTGFCMIPTQAHAVPQSVQSTDMGTHCAKAHAGDHQHSSSCYHCDQPDELSSSNLASFATVALLLPGVISAPVFPQWQDVSSGLLSTRTPTGPPRSSSLLFTTTQRIRV